MGRWAEQDGTVSAFVAVLAIALVAVAGLAFDGGAIITAHAHARDVAQAAARAGAQQLDAAEVHAGTTDLDPVAAHEAATAFLDAADASGTVTVDGPQVHVTVTVSQPMRILPVADRTITATGSSTAISDVLGGR